MQSVMGHLDEISGELEQHELYQWMTSRRHADARRHYDNFIPILGMIITFPYYNDQYLTYAAAATDDDRSDGLKYLASLREIINEHAREDRTHAKFFLHDLRALELAQLWGIERPSTLLWTLWVSPLLDPAQEVSSNRIRTLVDPRDEWPPFRYLHIEQLERDGNLLFTASTRKGAEIEEQTSIAPVYFAMHHLERETGHVGGAEFDTVALSDEQTARGREIVERKHADSVAMNDVMLRFAQKAESLDKPGLLLVAEQEARLERVRERVRGHLAGTIETPTWDLPSPTYAEQSELIAAYYRHHAGFVNHPFAALFRAARGADAVFALRVTALILARRICALHPFYKFDCRVDDSVTGPAADVVNFLSATLATEAQLFFHDWDVLDMDRRIPWNTADLLEWWFFDPIYGRPELETLHEFRREALRVHDDPIIKYWVFMSIDFMSRAFFGSSRVLTQRFVQDNPALPPLVYLNGTTSHLLYEEGSPDWLRPPFVTSLAHMPITVEQRDHILRMMDVFAVNGRKMFDNLAHALTTDRGKFAFLE